MVKLADVAGKFLAEGQRGGVLQVGAANLDDAGEGFSLGIERIAQCFHGRNEQAVDFLRGGNMNGGWKNVIRRLRVIDMVVRMHLYPRIRPHGNMRNHLVHIHIALRPGARLPDLKRKLLRILPVDNVPARIPNAFCSRLIQHSELLIRLCRRIL